MTQKGNENWGGARKNSGRKAIKDGQKVVTYLPKKLVRELDKKVKALGTNRSRFIRELVDGATR